MKKRLKALLNKFKTNSSSHTTYQKKSLNNIDKIAIVGSPNVGKSAIFNALTGTYIIVSNYPGTTVEVSRGKVKLENIEFEIIDTPGMYSLLPITGEEEVARTILLEEQPKVIVQVVDAKNLEKMLPFTIQLIEAGLPIILNLNMIDEAERVGLYIDKEKLQEYLGIPVVDTIATKGVNIDELKRKIIFYSQKNGKKEKIINYDKDIEIALEKIETYLKKEYNISKRSIGLLILSGDEELTNVVSNSENNYQPIEKIIKETKARYPHPINYILMVERQKKAVDISNKCITQKKRLKVSFKEKLSWITMNPWTGIPLFLLVIIGLYEFVGVFGAQIAVEFLEGTVFGNYINPFVTRWITEFIPWKVLQDLFVGDYGIITLGLRYAVALILPIVATFFIAFSIIEDTGYLPRLAMLIDRVFKKIGLNGRAVIPIVLGFGCGTMATMVTRTQETKRERIITTLLLALAVPCSAQLGVMLALLAGNWKAFWIWAIVILFVFILIGFLSSKIMPGKEPLFFMEVPPLRWPKLSNIFIKTFARVNWYFKEIFPLFILASVIIWLGKITKVFDLLIKIIEYPVQWIGLPKETAVAFLFGFFRRDYGAAGLYDLKVSGLLQGTPLIVAVITLTLFLPCVAQFSIIIKERGLKVAFLMAGFVIIFAFLIGGLINLILTYSGANI